MHRYNPISPLPAGIRAAAMPGALLCAVVLAATSAAAATPPSAPIIGTGSPGNGLAAIAFTPPSSNGGAPILNYTATCISGAAGSPAIGGHGLGLDFIGQARNPLPTSTFTTTSGSIILASVGRGVFADFATSTVSDNKGNGTYTAIGTPHTYSLYTSSGTALYAKTNAAGGSGHIVNTTKPSLTDEVTVIAAEFRNVDTIVDSKWIEDRTPPNTSASLTTTGPAILAAFWWGDDSNGELNPAVDANWTVLDHTSSLASNHVQSASAYRIVSAAGTYSITWTPSTPQGAQLWIVAMQHVAGGPPVTATGLSSPIIVKGLTNGTGYNCSVTATNSAGTSASSASIAVTPSAATPFALIGVQSRKTHSGAGSFDLPIDTQPVGGQVSVEPRFGSGGGSGHLLVYQFNGPVSAPGSAGVSPIGTAGATHAGNEVFVSLTNIPDKQRLDVTLSNVNGAFSPAPLALGFLVGDGTNSRAVNAADISGAKSRAGQGTDGSNFRFDVNLSGTVDSTDVSVVKARSGVVLP